MKVLVAMSGGVDSSASALLLKRAGYDVDGAIMRLSPFSDGSDVNAARSVCESIGIGFHVFDMREKFKSDVMEPFCREYMAGNTPNPCVTCNRRMKFGAFLDKARSLGYDKIATGHYARIKKIDGRYAVCRAECLAKDQSYVLWQLPQSALQSVIFPLGDISSKDDVRKLVRDAGITMPSGGESQDICFVPSGDYAAFLSSYENYTPQPGDFIDINGKVLGKHKGHINYTVGQRRYLGISAGKRIFVLSKNPENNTVTLGDEELLYTDRLAATQLNFQARVLSGGPHVVSAQIRYGKKTTEATLLIANGDEALLQFKAPQRAPTPGQSVVFYDEDTVIGGGIICEERRK